MDVLVFDAITPLRDWLRTQATNIGPRWDAGKLRSGIAYPAGRITRVGGGDLEPCLDRPLVQLDIFDVSGESVAKCAAQVTSLLRSTPERTVLRAATGGDPSILFMGASIVGNDDHPDDVTGEPIRSLTVDLSTLAIP